jgi:alginate O-acetyltransferase complex protein AlgI
MLFSSTIFLFVFLPVVTGIYFLCPKSWRNGWLLAASLFFYAWGEPRYLAVMLFSIGVNYTGARLLGVLAWGKGMRRGILSLVCVLNLGMLVYFKYADFFIANTNAATGWELTLFGVWMPIGISFFTFQSLSYVIDVYRHQVKPQRSLAKTALFISFFPQLIAGPILKYHDICRQIDERTETWADVAAGLRRFSIGLGKKVLLANTLGAVADPIFALPTVDMPLAWLGAVTYALQLFFDFSGYSDMAIGLARIFGFRILENFNYPYISKSITEFWRRWHISLGSWFREYLYFPLGGNQKGTSRTVLNLLIVFLATGLWHGANWTFLVWGLWHGLFIILERISGFTSPGSRIKQIGLHLYAIAAFGFGWVLFRSETLTGAWHYWQSMLGLGSSEEVLFTVSYFVTRKVLLAIAIGLLISTPVCQKVRSRMPNRFWVRSAGDLFLLGILFLSILSIASGTYNPFIYFRF